MNGRLLALLARHRGVAWLLVAAAVVVPIVYFGTPNLAGVRDTIGRIEEGSPAWLALCVAVELPSFAGYAFVLMAVARAAGGAMGVRDAWQVSLAGAAATRFLGAGGAGGIAVTAIGLRRSGLSARDAAEAITADLVVLYAWFLALLAGSGLLVAALGHGHGEAITLVPAGLALVALAGMLAVALAPEERMARLESSRDGWVGRLLSAPAAGAGGARRALALLRGRPAVAFAGLAWWAFDVAALWAAFHAFGGSPAIPELVLGYFVGQCANLLPIPGGVGAEGGITGALIALGQPAGLALIAVLAYRVCSVWLPAIPGAFALARINRVGAS